MWFRKPVAALILLIACALSPVATPEAQISPTYTFTSGTTIRSGEVNANFNLLANALNRTNGTMTGQLNTQHVVPVTSNTYDLGSATFFFRTLYARTSVVFGQTTANYTLTWANPAAARAISLEDPLGTDVFVWKAATQTLTNKTLTSPVINGSVTGSLAIAEASITDGTIFPRFADTAWTMGANGILSANTADAGDTSSLNLAGGGTTGATRGAYIELHGNEAAGDGAMNLVPGDIGLVKVFGNFLATGRYLSATTQPGFLVYNSAGDVQNNGDTVDFDTEVYDTSSSFATDTFTAPVTGIYQLCATVTIGLASGTTATFTFISSNRSYRMTPGPQGANGCVFADMDAADTVYVQAEANSGFTTQGTSSPYQTFFSGRLMP